MGEQFNLPLNIPPLPPKEKQLKLSLKDNPDNWTPEKLAPLETVELQTIYCSVVGKNPTYRGFDDDTLRQGILDPTKELDRLRQIDAESDQEDIKQTYRR